MYRHFFSARQLVGVPVHLGSGNRVSVPTTITGSRRFLATATLAAVLVVAAEVTFLFNSRSSWRRRDRSHSGKRGLAPWPSIRATS